MKKQIILISIIAILISSCATIEPSIASIIYDESVPTEGTAMIAADQGTIIGYNGIDVNWKAGKVIQIPSGDTLLEWNIVASDGTTKVIGKGIQFHYNFQPQKFYKFWVPRNNEVWGFNVYAYEYGEKFKKFDKHFVEFVPFLNVK